MRRTLAGLTQTVLATALGVSFQQVQKYEKGTNRVSASRLQQMSAVLGVPVEWFFADGPESSGQANSGQGSSGQGSSDLATRFFADREGARLAKAYLALTDPKQRRALLELTEAMAGRDEE